MKLVTYMFNGSQYLGCLINEQVADLNAVSAFLYTSRNESLTHKLPESIEKLLIMEEDSWKILRHSFNWCMENKTDALRYSTPIERVKILPPVHNPSKIICVGLNYYDHCIEQQLKVPTSPVLFAKFPSSIIGQDDIIQLPSTLSNQVDFESELAIVIKKKARNVWAQDYMNYVAGYTILNDISARDIQSRDQQWVRAKSFDTFCPFGPTLVTPDEIGEPNNLAICCRLNQKLMQNSNTSKMIFKIPFLIEFITSFCTLLPGDIISTGTPNGVGSSSKPQRFLKTGDLLEVEIEKIGCLRNTVN